MEALFFILKTILLNALFVGVIGIIIGLIRGWKNGAHPHQIFPEWIVWAGFGAIIAAVIGLIISILLYAMGSSDLVDTSICVTGLGVMGLLGLWSESR